jgi:ribosomal protein L7/L12
LEHYHDIPSLQLYVKQTAATEMQGLLARTKVEWKDIHRALAIRGLELHKAEHGGYTVHATGTELWCKASDVFRRSFSGKVNREATEKKLGPWQAATADDRIRPPNSTRYEKCAEATANRQEQRDAREQAREKLKKRFGVYRTELRSEQKKYTTIVKVNRNLVATSLKDAKRLIRSEDITWTEKRVKLSQAVAQSVTSQRLLKAEVMRGRLERQGLTYQAWVVREAQAGDLAAASQLRGWRYTDQRNIRKSDALMNSQTNALHLSSGADTRDTDSEYAEVVNSRLRELLRNEVLAKSLAAARWTINRSTGDVQYTVRGALAFVDRGRTISVFTTEESATVLALEMAVKKYGATLNAEGSQQWKERIACVAAKNGAVVEFSDASMGHTMFQEQMRLDKYDVMAKQLSELQLRVAAHPDAAFQLADRAAAEVFMGGVWGQTRGRNLVNDLQAKLKRGETRQVNVKGVFVLEVALELDGQAPIFTARPLAGQGAQLNNMLKAGSLKMCQLADVERQGRSKPLRQKQKSTRQDIDR